MFYGYNPTYFLVLFLLVFYFFRNGSFKVLRSGLMESPSSPILGIFQRFSRATILF